MKSVLSLSILAFCTFLHLLPSVTSQNCPRPTAEGALTKCLLQNYEKTVRPALSASDTIIVSFLMYLRVIDLDEHAHTMTIHTWTFWEWVDNFLKWIPADHENVQSITIPSDAIWNPDVKLLTTGDASMHNGMPSTHCRLKFKGVVTCSPPTTFVAHCALDQTRWPFDEQKCITQMGSWKHLQNTLNLTLQDKGVNENYLLPNKMWQLKRVEAANPFMKVGSEVFPYLEFTFILRRYGAGYAATAVVPAFVLAMLTLLTFLLDPECSERLTLGGCGILGHILFLQYVSWLVPPNGDEVPMIVVFFRDSLLLVGASLAATVALRRLLRTRVPPPEWLRSAAAVMLSTTPGQLLLLSTCSARGSAATAGTAGEDGDSLVTSNDVSSGGGAGGGGRGGVTGAVSGGGSLETWEALDDTWRLAAIFLDRVLFAIFFAALLVLFGRYVA